MKEKSKSVSDLRSRALLHVCFSPSPHFRRNHEIQRAVCSLTANPAREQSRKREYEVQSRECIGVVECVFLEHELVECDDAHAADEVEQHVQGGEEQEGGRSARHDGA